MPFMQLNSGMDNPSAGMLATYNYLGYLIGAMIPIWIIVFNKVVDLKIYLIINIISTLFMGFDNYISWAILDLLLVFLVVLFLYWHQMLR